VAGTAALGRVSDFSPIAARYDATRDMPERFLLACYDRLLERGLFPGRGRVLDAGCGTGQVSLPLAARGYEIRGLDISAAMVAIAGAKLSPEWRASYGVGDVRRIAEPDGSFDAAVVSKLFQHIEDWQKACRELIRVVRPGSPIVQINERGFFGNAVRRYFSKRADELGFTGRFLGLNPSLGAAASGFMRAEGCEVVAVDMADLGWRSRISHGEALEQIRDGLYAEFWYLPADVHSRLVSDTIAWVDAQPQGLETVEELRPYLQVEVFRTPAAAGASGSRAEELN
jgi:SAM-dependent methyltransferase